ncbi:MAG: HAMP domain-containing sensor histidine kinase [Planctomycetota bacterium]
MITTVGIATLLGGVVGALAVGDRRSAAERDQQMLRDVRTLAVGMPSAGEGEAFARARLCLQRLLRARDDLIGASCWLRADDVARDLFVAEGDVGEPAALRGYVGVGLATVVAPHTAIAPLINPDGTSQGVVLLHRRPDSDTPLPLWPVPVAVLAMLAGFVAHRRFGRPIERIAAVLPDQRPLRSLTLLADAVANDLSSPQINARIDRQVRVRTRELEQSLRQRDEAVAMTAHELRTPLTAILASVEMVRDGYATTDEERTQFLEQASTSGQHMLLLLNDLLDRAAFEAGKLRVEMTSCFVEDLLGDAMRLLAPAAVARQTTIRVDIAAEVERPVLADAGRVLQVVFNLVSNALKYSPAGAPVEVRARCMENGARIEVEDCGMGIAPEAERRLFKRFSRVHESGSSNASGTGIGLHVSKALVESMGGEIGYRPRETGLGSVFWFSLAWAPLERPGEVREATTHAHA